MNNEEKIFNLLEKIYVQLEETKTELKSTKQELKEEIQENRQAIVKIESKIETEISDKIRGLYDAREVTNHKLNSIDEKLDKLQFDVNNLTMKVAQNDNRIIELKHNLKNVK